MEKWPGGLWEFFGMAGFPLQEEQRQRFERYAKELLLWNRKINLTSLTQEEEIIIKHFLGSLIYLRGFEPKPNLEVLDLGSGGGFPGLPIKILHPEISLSLVEAGQKKVAFLKHIGRILDLKGIRYEAHRSETLARQTNYQEAFDIVLCRAVGKLEKTIAFSFPLLKPGGNLVTQKGRNLESEVQNAAKVLTTYCATVERIIPVTLPWKGIRFVLLVIHKAIPT